MAGEGRVGWTGGVCQQCSEETSGYQEWEMGGGGDLPPTVGGGGGWGGVLLQMERRVGVEDRVV